MSSISKDYQCDIDPITTEIQGKKSLLDKSGHLATIYAILQNAQGPDHYLNESGHGQDDAFF